MQLKKAILNVSGEMGIPEEVVKAAYVSQWKFIKEHIEALPLKGRPISKEEFEKFRTNFNVPSLGKMSCTYDRYLTVKKGYEAIKKLKDVQDKEN